MQTILVVDDEPIVREVVERYLRQDGFAVETAADGTEALRRFAAARPDLVLLDLMLPGVDGLEVCRRIRTQSNVRVPSRSLRRSGRRPTDPSGLPSVVRQPTAGRP